jgi:hypothetical protein
MATDVDVMAGSTAPPSGYGPNDPTPWKCVPNVTVQVRSTADGHVECGGRPFLPDRAYWGYEPCIWETCPEIKMDTQPVKAIDSTESCPDWNCVVGKNNDYLNQAKPALADWGWVESRCIDDPVSARCKAALNSAGINPHHPREDKALLKYCMMNLGSCDTYMKDYCSKNPSDPKCACITSDMLKFKYNPLCTDQKCIQGGYQTNSMISARGQGCEIVDCSTYLQAKAGGKVDFSDVNIQQRCGSGTASTTGNAKPSSNINDTSLSSVYSNHKTLFIGLGIGLAALLVIILLFVVLSSRK